MTDYRRAFVAGGCYFFTVVTQDRRPLFAQAEAVARLREGFRRVKAAHPFEIDAIVILPDHLHAVWRLPEGDADFPLRWRKIKHYVSIGAEAPAQRPSLARRREKGIWQRRYWEHAIRDEPDWQKHVDYVHFNPVKHGYVTRPGDWPHSSFSRALRAGWYPSGWGGTITDFARWTGAGVGGMTGRERHNGHATLCPSYRSGDRGRLDEASADDADAALEKAEA